MFSNWAITQWAKQLSNWHEAVMSINKIVMWMVTVQICKCHTIWFTHSWVHWIDNWAVYTAACLGKSEWALYCKWQIKGRFCSAVRWAGHGPSIVVPGDMYLHNEMEYRRGHIDLTFPSGTSVKFWNFSPVGETKSLVLNTVTCSDFSGRANF